MKILVTGADGFVGPWLTARLMRDGHDVTPAVRSPSPETPGLPLELRDPTSIEALVACPLDAVIHLAGVASGSDARRDPGSAWEVNAVGTACLCEALADRRQAMGDDPLVVLASTGEVYGAGRPVPRVESDPLLPCSPYAASKLGAEVAALEVHRRTGLRVVVARAFPHTGQGQDTRFVVPAFARRLAEARRAGRRTVRVGNLDLVRDILHVSDVVEAYARLLVGGEPGQAYNVASGYGITIREVLERLAAAAGVDALPETDPALRRSGDVPHLVGDARKLQAVTGWRPQVSLDDALAEVTRAQAN